MNAKAIRVMTLDTKDHEWTDAMPPERWIRVEVGGEWYDLREDRGGLQIMTERPMQVEPSVSNAVTIRTKER